MAADIIINADVQFELSKIIKRFENLIDDDQTMLEIYNLFGKIIEPWVPMDTGLLANSYEAAPNYLRYPGPYAHYQYMGIVYGPNIPMFNDDGQLIGFYSPPKKEPTGQEIQYNTEKHERASKEWDKAAMEVKMDEFLEGVKAILIRRNRNLNG